MRSAIIGVVILLSVSLFAQTPPTGRLDDDLNQAEAESITFKDWFVGHEETFLVAATRPDRTSKALMYICYPGSPYCLVGINLELRCEADQQHSILINHPNASFAVDGLCRTGDAGNSLLITDKKLLNLLREKTTGHIGFAVGMEGGLFKIVRFSLDGSSEAIAYVDRRTDAAEYK